MRSAFLLVALNWLAASTGAAGEEPVVLQLGGPRKVQATLSVRGADYAIAIRMLPVTVFDPATNAHINQEKARNYALQALASHLSPKRDVTLSVVGATVSQAQEDGKVYRLTLLVPRKGVTVAEATADTSNVPAGETKPRERVSFSSALFTIEEDYRATVQTLGKTLRAEVRALKDHTTSEAEDPDYLPALQQVEKSGMQNLERVAAAIRSDSLVSEVSLFGRPAPRDQLLGEVERARQALREQVARARDRHEKWKGQK